MCIDGHSIFQLIVVVYEMMKQFIWFSYLRTSLLKWAGYYAIFMEWNDHATSTFLGTLGMAPPPRMGWAVQPPLSEVRWTSHVIIIWHMST